MEQRPSRERIEEIIFAAKAIADIAQHSMDDDIVQYALLERIQRWRSLDAGRWAIYPDLTRFKHPPAQAFANCVVPYDRWIGWHPNVADSYAELVLAVADVVWEFRNSEEVNYAPNASQVERLSDAADNLHPKLTMRADGPEPPRYFWWDGERFELSIETRPWNLLIAIWGNEETPVRDVGLAVWNDRYFDYSKMRNVVKKLNNAFSASGIPLFWEKPKDRDCICLVESGTTSP